MACDTCRRPRRFHPWLSLLMLDSRSPASLDVFINIPHSQLRQLRPQPVEVEAQLALAQALAALLFLRHARVTQARDLGRLVSRHDDDAVHVGDDDVAGAAARAAA